MKPNNLLSLLLIVSSILIIIILVFFNYKMEKNNLLLVDKIDSMSYQLDSLKTQNDEAKEPVLILAHNTITRNEEFGVRLINKGNVRVFIKNINAKFKDKWYRDLYKDNKIVSLLQAMGVDGLWAEFTHFETANSFNYETSIIPQEKIFVIRAVKGKYSYDEYLRNCKKFGLSMSKLYIEIEYCSRNGECKWLKHDFSKEPIYLDALPD